MQTKYTMAAHSGDGFLCHQCAKASGTDPFKKPAKPAAPRKREKRTIVNFEERNFPTLVSMCVQVRITSRLYTSKCNKYASLADQQAH